MGTVPSESNIIFDIYFVVSTLTTPSPATARYWATLKDLSNDVKLELISLLSTSMRKTDEDWTESFAGKWQDERSTEEITDDIRAARNAHMKEGIIERMKQCGEANCFVADVTVMELRYGAYNSNKSQENLVAVNNFLKKVKTVPFAESIDIFCQEKVRLKKLGKKLEDFDLLIGSSAKAKGLIMVTDNVKHFDRIEGIIIENWVSR